MTAFNAIVERELLTWPEELRQEFRASAAKYQRTESAISIALSAYVHLERFQERFPSLANRLRELYPKTELDSGPSHGACVAESLLAAANGPITAEHLPVIQEVMDPIALIEMQTYQDALHGMDEDLIPIAQCIRSLADKVSAIPLLRELLETRKADLIALDPEMEDQIACYRKPKDYARLQTALECYVRVAAAAVAGGNKLFFARDVDLCTALTQYRFEDLDPLNGDAGYLVICAPWAEADWFLLANGGESSPCFKESDKLNRVSELEAEFPMDNAIADAERIHVLKRRMRLDTEAECLPAALEIIQAVEKRSTRVPASVRLEALAVALACTQNEQFGNAIVDLYEEISGYNSDSFL
ncbi:MAG: hypothetical protein KDK78_09395 [Chlamydiia bacterium]|nr:hypothetical protein [Chlamydiia bacterium]